jgi:hypothetical protein
MATMNRKQIEDAVKRGEHVAVGPIVLRRDPVSLRPDAATTQAAFATPADPEKPDEFEAVIVRGADGKLTRAGMEHAIRHGGSVMIEGTSITSLDGLPDEVELARGDEERLAAFTAALDAQIAAIAVQRQQAQTAAERARSQRESQGSPRTQERTSVPGEGAGEASHSHPSPPLPEGVPAHPSPQKATQAPAPPKKLGGK